jgi:uncharacterized repeat protein (TIGR03803 family)
MKLGFCLLALCLMTTVCPAQPRLMCTTVVPDSTFSGMNPESELTLGSDGLLYGAAPSGGAFGHGSIFKATIDGAITFVPFDGTNGSVPYYSPLQVADGIIYGMATTGGNMDAGTVYRLNTNGILAAIYSFDMTNGSRPASLMMGKDGNLYGVTGCGGIGFDGTAYSGDGIAFRLTTNGVFTHLASFSEKYAFPNSIVEANDGNFYGTTQQGGPYGYGTVFRMTPDGQLSTLVTFDGTNGAYANPIILGSDGALYGCTSGINFLDANDRSGKVYRITTNGDFTILHTFSFSDGAEPRCRLLEVTNGLFYGTTYISGRSAGTVFQIATNGDFATVFYFDSSRAKGCLPRVGLAKGGDGNYYGLSTQPVRDLYCLRPVEAPLFQPSMQDGQITLNWKTWGRLPVGLYYKTNLNEADWHFLDGVATETNAVISHTEPVDPDTPRFYTLQMNIREEWW